MFSAHYELVFIFLSVIVGVLSAAYFYLSTRAFDNLHMLQRPLRWIAVGMFLIAIGVLLAAFISYEEKQGFELLFYGLPLQVFFYILYIVGSCSIFFGARRFTRRPQSGTVDVALQGR